MHRLENPGCHRPNLKVIRFPIWGLWMSFRGYSAICPQFSTNVSSGTVYMDLHEPKEAVWWKWTGVVWWALGSECLEFYPNPPPPLAVRLGTSPFSLPQYSQNYRNALIGVAVRIRYEDLMGT